MIPGHHTLTTLIIAAVAFAPLARAGQAPDPAAIEESFYFHGPAAMRCAEKFCVEEEGDAWDQCREKQCQGAKEDWSLEVTKVRYDGDTLAVSGKLGYAFKPGGPEGFKPRTDPIWLGMTVKNMDGSLVDVPARRVPMAKIPGPFEFKARVGPKAHTWQVAAWHMEMKPCNVDRPGCKQNGHVLVGLLAWSPHCAYQCVMASDCGFGTCMGGTPILPGKGPVEVRVLDAGGGAAWAKKAVAAARKVLDPSADRNGRKLVVRTKGKARNARKCLEVLYRDERNARRAAVVAAQVLEAGGFAEETEWGTDYPEHKVTHWDKAPVDIVVAVGKGCSVGG